MQALASRLDPGQRASKSGSRRTRGCGGRSRLEQKTRKLIGGPGSRTPDINAVGAPQRLEFAGTMGPAPLRWGFDLSAVDAANTAVVLWVEAEPRGPSAPCPPGCCGACSRR